MKNSKITKILIFTLTVALLAVTAFAFSVSAEETAQTDPELEIAGKNIVYGDTFTIQYAVSTSKITADAELVIGNSAGVLGSAKFSKTETTDKITGTEDTYYVFEVTGIPASDVCEDIIVHVEDGDKVGPELKYSLGEYFYERLYVDDVINATDGKALYQKDLYLNYLAYAASAQNLFKNFDKGLNVTLVTDYYYAYVEDGTINGGDNSEMFDPNVSASVTLAYTGTSSISGWSVTTYTAEGSTTKEIGVDEGVTLTGHTIITPVEGIATLTEGETFENLTTLEGKGEDSDVKFARKSLGKSTLGLVQDGDTIEIAQDPIGAANKVLKFQDGSSSNYTAVCLNTKSNVTNGISVFETKLYVASDSFTGTSTYVAQLTFSSGYTAKGKTINFKTNSDKSGVYLAVDDTTDADFEASGKDVYFSTDAWHVMRLEYYNYADTANSCIKVYIDGLYAGKITSSLSADDVDGFQWKGYSAGLCTVYFDNISYTEKAMPTE